MKNSSTIGLMIRSLTNRDSLYIVESGSRTHTHTPLPFLTLLSMYPDGCTIRNDQSIHRAASRYPDGLMYPDGSTIRND